MAAITKMASTNTMRISQASPFVSNRILDLPNRPKFLNEDGSVQRKAPVRMLPCLPTHVPAMVDVYMSAFGGGTFAHWWPENREVMRPWTEERFTNRFKDGRSVQFVAIADGGGGGGGQEGTGGVIQQQDVLAYAKWTLPKPDESVGDAAEDQYTMLRRAFGLAAAPDDAVDSPRAVNNVATDGSATTTNVEPEVQNGQGKDNHGEHPVILPEGVNASWYHEYFDGMRQLGEKYGTDQMLELSLVCTRPSAHGQGIAGAMIRSVLEEVADPLGIRTVLMALELAAPLYRRLGFVTVEEMGFEKAREEAGENGVMHVMVREPRAARSQDGL